MTKDEAIQEGIKNIDVCLEMLRESVRVHQEEVKELRQYVEDIRELLQKSG